mmetsp:Transcript_17219/g.39712  ORF Transcript_17219/g.39712 Transcript_17219/m.39712 type:complete len:208 (+) Transcript_17219:199-822(+)
MKKASRSNWRPRSDAGRCSPCPMSNPPMMPMLREMGLMPILHFMPPSSRSGTRFVRANDRRMGSSIVFARCMSASFRVSTLGMLWSASMMPCISTQVLEERGPCCPVYDTGAISRMATDSTSSGKSRARHAAALPPMLCPITQHLSIPRSSSKALMSAAMFTYPIEVAWLLSPWLRKSGMMMRLGICSSALSALLKLAKFLEDPRRP